jgi:hypothetical protein
MRTFERAARKLEAASLILLFYLFSSGCCAFATPREMSAGRLVAVLASRFELDAGSGHARRGYVASGHGYDFHLTASEVLFPLAGLPRGLRMRLVGSNKKASAVAEKELPGKTNRFIGSDPAKWRTGIPGYAQVRYRSVYPGIDVVYHGNAGRLEYDFIIAPGANPAGIRLAFRGMRQMRLDRDGDLLLRTSQGELCQRRPRLYQDKAGARLEISGGYQILNSGEVGFAIGRYDSHLPLVIDPVLNYSTYLGGSQWDSGYGITTDAAGNVYVVGETFSANFPVHGMVQSVLAGDKDVFVSKLNPAGTMLLYSTFLGGNRADSGLAIAVDSSANIYITGVTSSSNFPTTPGAYRSNSSGLEDAFVAKLNPAGTLVYSTYLGDGGSDYGVGIAVDSSANAYVTGYTSSVSFPVTAGSLQGLSQGGYDAFVTKINPLGSALAYSTYLG